MSRKDVGEFQLPFYKALGFSTSKNMPKLWGFSDKHSFEFQTKPLCPVYSLMLATAGERILALLPSQALAYKKSVEASRLLCFL